MRNALLIVKLKHFAFFVLLALISLSGLHAAHVECGGFAGDGCHTRGCCPVGKMQQASDCTVPQKVSVIRRAPSKSSSGNTFSPCPGSALPQTNYTKMRI
jgi:hypothetical protein